MEKEKLAYILFCTALISAICLVFITILLHIASNIIATWEPLPSRTVEPARSLVLSNNRIRKHLHESFCRFDTATGLISNWFDLLTYYTMSVTVITCTLPVWKTISAFLIAFPNIAFIEPALSFCWIIVSILVIWLFKKWWKISITLEEQSSLRLLAAFHSFILMIMFIKNIDMESYKYYFVSYFFFLIGRFIFVDTNKKTLGDSWEGFKNALRFWFLLLILLGTDFSLYYYLELNDLHEDIFMVVLLIHFGILMALHIVKYKTGSICAFLFDK